MRNGTEDIASGNITFSCCRYKLTDPRVSNECSANREVDTNCHFT